MIKEKLDISVLVVVTKAHYVQAIKDDIEQSTSEIAPQATPLLNIPPELRNKIYRFSLVNTGDPFYTNWVDVNHYWPEQPALLQTCRQIKQEATSIYYEENEFFLCVGLLDNMPTSQHWILTQAPCHHVTVNLVCSDKVSWSGLNTWLRRYYEGGVSGLHTGEPHLQYAFRIVKAMQDVPWSTVEKVLELYREVLEITCNPNNGTGCTFVDKSTWEHDMV